MANVTEWNSRLSTYAVADPARSAVQLAVTLAIFAGALAAAFACYRVFALLALPASCVAGIMLVRLFIVQHDCGHRSFLKSRVACDWIGRSLSVLTLTPYGYWRRDHDKHHATSGNLDKRGFGDIKTLTVREYRDLGFWGRASYRAYRNPAVLFGIGPTWQFLIRFRMPFGLGGRSAVSSRSSILLTNGALAAFLGVLVLALGFRAVAVVWLPTVVTAATLGIWMFYVQHQFDETYWRRDGEWGFVDAAMQGCSFYRLPAWMHWATGWIGYHHIHHLSSRIPSYNLPKAFAEIPELRTVKSIGIMESLRCIRLTLWCEERCRLVTFREARA